MKPVTYALLAGAWLILANGAIAKESTEAVDAKYTWDLTEIYPSVEAWNEARDEVMQDFVELEERRGTLGKSADSLYKGMQMYSDAYRNAARVSVYASLMRDEDLRITETQERAQLGDIMFARFSEATAWIQPEVLKVGREVIESYINEDSCL